MTTQDNPITDIIEALPSRWSARADRIVAEMRAAGKFRRRRIRGCEFPIPASDWDETADRNEAVTALTSEMSRFARTQLPDAVCDILCDEAGELFDELARDYILEAI